MIVRIPSPDPKTRARSQALFDDLASQPASVALDWLDRVEAGTTWAPALDFASDWAHFLATAGHNGQDYGVAEWIHVVIRVQEALHDHWQRRDPAYSDGFLYDAMVNRSGLICKHGHRPEDPFLDMEIVINWVRGELVVSLDDAKRMAIEWKQSPTRELASTLHQLRRALL